MIENMSHRPDLRVIAGPCSFDPENTEQYHQLSEIRVTDEQGRSLPALWGTRVVGAKSRSVLNATGEGMGSDAAFIEEAIVLQKEGKKPEGIPPSVTFAEEFCRKTGLLIASEIMLPEIQLPLYESRLPARKFMPWNASVDQLGWHILQMAQYCRENGWYLGIKNGKWLGDVSLEAVSQPEFHDQTSLERTWTGLATWAQGINGRLIMIHRGVDVEGKNEWRGAPVHQVAKKAKAITGADFFYDPNHSNGEKRQKEIGDDIIETMQIKDEAGEFLYSGLLAEAGEAPTDTNQHLTIARLDDVIQELAEFRGLTPPERIM
jgi:hypothetical protein